MLKHYLPILLLMISLASFGQSETASLKNERPENHEKQAGTRTEVPMTGFVKTDALQCNRTQVVVTTSCLSREENLPYCFNQNVAFVDRKNGDLISNFSYRYAFSDGSQEFIAGATCVADGKDSYVVLTNTNFSNCKTCEWADVFTPTGRYVGSTKGRYSDQTFKRKRLSTALSRRILTSTEFADSATHQNSIHISRTPK